MPNWNENELTITGPDVNKVLETIRSQSGDDQDIRLFDFNTVIPYPQIYRDMDRRAEEYRERLQAIANDDPQRKQKLEALGLEYGVEPGTPWIKDGFNSGGYEWCCDMWGTKWQPCNIHLTTRADSSQPVRKTSKCLYCNTVQKTDSMQLLTCQQCGSPLPDCWQVNTCIESVLCTV